MRDFATLHGRITQRLSGTCNCGPITQDKTLGARFEVRPRNSGYRILVFQREFLTPAERERRHADAQSRIASILKRGSINAAEVARLGAATQEIYRLPGWSYARVGVDVTLQEPDVVYHGFDKDTTEANRCFHEIVGMLKPYRAN